MTNPLTEKIEYLQGELQRAVLEEKSLDHTDDDAVYDWAWRRLRPNLPVSYESQIRWIAHNSWMLGQTIGPEHTSPFNAINAVIQTHLISELQEWVLNNSASWQADLDLEED